MKKLLRRVVSFFFILSLKLFTLITHRPRARVLAVNEFNEVLLVQAYVSHGSWALPGGGLERNESATAAAVRELYEETGIKIEERELALIATLKKPEHDIPFTAPVFRVTIKKAMLPVKLANPREIITVGWYDRSNLPKPLSLIAQTAIEIDNSNRGETLR